jgi:hypothetical protein
LSVILAKLLGRNVCWRHIVSFAKDGLKGAAVEASPAFQAFGVVDLEGRFHLASDCPGWTNLGALRATLAEYWVNPVGS